MITAADLLVHLEAKVEAAVAVEDEDLPARLEEVGRFVRDIAETALVAGDAVTLQEARRLAARLEALGGTTEVGASPRGEQPVTMHICPRCGQRFRSSASPFERVGAPLCEACTRELLAGIRL